MILKAEKKYYDAIDNANSGKSIISESDVSNDDLISYNNSPLQTKKDLTSISEIDEL